MDLVLTEEEKDLLCTVYPSQLQQQYIREGTLLEEQKQTLSRMRGIVEWLQKKYPSHSFRIVSVDRGNPDDPGADYVFTADGGEARYHAAAQGDGTFRESYYAALLAEPCTERLERLLAARGVPLAGVEIDFLGLAGDEVTEQTDAETLLAMGEQVSRRSTVFLCGDETAVRRARAEIEALGLAGGYWLFASERLQTGMGAAACWEIKRAGGGEFFSDSFLLGQEAQT